MGTGKMAEIKNSTLDDISSVIGFSATVRLAAHFGGGHLEVPVTVSEKNKIAKLIGVSALTQLHANWSGMRLVVPSLRIVRNEARSAKVLRLLLAGKSTKNVADEAGCTMRRVQQLRREHEASGMLPLIFHGKIDLENCLEKLP